jgi:uncharacterized protein (TIGR02300 family)
VPKPEWGIKRICQSCEAKFYDLQSSPIICPGCGKEFKPDAAMPRDRRARSSAAPKAAPVKAPKKPPEADAADEDKGSPEPDEVEVAKEELPTDADIDEDVADTGDEDLIEDTSKLGEDDDSKVVAGAIEDNNEER